MTRRALWLIVGVLVLAGFLSGIRIHPPGDDGFRAAITVGDFGDPVNAQQLARIFYFDNQTVTNAAVRTACQGSATCTADVSTNQAFLSVETNPIRWRADGTAPTTAIGHLANAGATITLVGHANVANFKMIATGANATVFSSVSRP